MIGVVKGIERCIPYGADKPTSVRPGQYEIDALRTVDMGWKGIIGFRVVVSKDITQVRLFHQLVDSLFAFRQRFVGVKHKNNMITGAYMPIHKMRTKIIDKMLARIGGRNSLLPQHNDLLT